MHFTNRNLWDSKGYWSSWMCGVKSTTQTFHATRAYVRGNPEEPNEVPGADKETPKSFTLTIPWNLASLVKNYPGNIVRQRHTDQNLMGLPEEQCAEWKKGHMPYCCNQVWTKNGGRIPWNVTAICETFKISCLMVRHLVKGDSENHLTDKWYRLEQWSTITLSLPKICRDCISSARMSCQVYSLNMCCTRRESGKETSWSRTLKNWRRWTHRKSTPEGSMQRKCVET